MGFHLGCDKCGYRSPSAGTSGLKMYLMQKLLPWCECIRLFGCKYNWNFNRNIPFSCDCWRVTRSRKSKSPHCFCDVGFKFDNQWRGRWKNSTFSVKMTKKMKQDFFIALWQNNEINLVIKYAVLKLYYFLTLYWKWI